MPMDCLDFFGKEIKVGCWVIFSNFYGAGVLRSGEVIKITTRSIIIKKQKEFDFVRRISRKASRYYLIVMDNNI